MMTFYLLLMILIFLNFVTGVRAIRLNEQKRILKDTLTTVRAVEKKTVQSYQLIADRLSMVSNLENQCEKELSQLKKHRTFIDNAVREKVKKTKIRSKRRKKSA